MKFRGFQEGSDHDENRSQRAITFGGSKGKRRKEQAESGGAEPKQVSEETRMKALIGNVLNN